MGNYALYQTEVKTEKSKKAFELVHLISKELGIHLPLIDDPASDLKLKDETYATIEAMNLDSMVNTHDYAPDDTPDAALHPLVNVKDDSIILYIPFTEKAGVIDESSLTGYSSDMFDAVIAFANKLEKVLVGENIKHAIAYDAKSEYETYKKRPFKKLTV